MRQQAVFVVSTESDREYAGKVKPVQIVVCCADGVLIGSCCCRNCMLAVESQVLILNFHFCF